MKKELKRYRELKTELENTNRLFRHSRDVRELQYLSKILSGKQLETELNYKPSWEQLNK